MPIKVTKQVLVWYQENKSILEKLIKASTTAVECEECWMVQEKLDINDKHYVVKLDSTSQQYPVPLIGNKAAGILKLMKLEYLGFKVPIGFVVTTQTYDEIFRLQANKLLQRAGSAKKAAEDLQKHFMHHSFGLSGRPCDFIQEHVEPVYDELCKQYGLENIGVAVRSSGIFEDLQSKSYAGSYESYMNTKGLKALVDSILLCFASAWKKHLLISYKKNKITEEVSMALIIQRFICADAAGVAFTADPVSGDTSKICINSAWGLGETVVSGKVSADIFCFDKKEMRLERKRPAEKTVASRCRAEGGTFLETLPPEMVYILSLTDINALRVARVCSGIEKELGYPVDVEWAYQNNELYLLQVRPITTL